MSPKHVSKFTLVPKATVAGQGKEEQSFYPFAGAAEDEAMVLKAQVLQLGASLDRGQSYNPTSGTYYQERFEFARSKVRELVDKQKGRLSVISSLTLGFSWP